MNDLVEVAPREITDVVYYCCRVAGIDPGTAQLMADNVTAAEIANGGAVAAFADGLGGPLATLMAEWAVDTDPPTAPTTKPRFGARRGTALRYGLHVPASALAALKAASSKFLVSEATVDAAVADS